MKKSVLLNVREQQDVPEIFELDAVAEIPPYPQYDFPGMKITFKGFLPGIDFENMALDTNADGGDLSITLEEGDTKTEYHLVSYDDSIVWAEV